MANKKYFKTRREASEHRIKIDPDGIKQLDVFKCPKGTRHSGEYIVTDYMGYLNMY